MKIDDLFKSTPESKPAEEKIEPKKALRIFDILDALTVNKTELDFEDDNVKKVYSQYMINTWLSMCDVLIDLANDMNSMQHLTDRQHFKMLFDILPQRKFYFKYTKRQKDLTESDKKYIAHYFEIGMKEAESYIKLMSDDEVNNILSKYVYGKNQKIKV